MHICTHAHAQTSTYKQLCMYMDINFNADHTHFTLKMPYVPQKAEFEAKVKEQQRRHNDLELARARNRVSIKREDEINMRGFDAITNQVFTFVDIYSNICPAKHMHIYIYMLAWSVYIRVCESG